MAPIFIVNTILLFATICLGEMSVTNPTDTDENSKHSMKPWELDVKKAKTLERLRGNEEIILRRAKRAWWLGGKKRIKEERLEFIDGNQKKPWKLDHKDAKTFVRLRRDADGILIRKKRIWWSLIWWGVESDNESNKRERSREFNVYCEAHCWSPWSAPSNCSVKCGNGGQRTRTRDKWVGPCYCPGEKTKVESCGSPCQNGGAPVLHRCRCRDGYLGECCEKRITCGNPGSPARGSVKPAGSKHYYGTQVTYSCNPGWQVSGGTNPRTCQGSGQWSGSLPSCTRRPCPHPGKPVGGSVAPTSGFFFEILVQFSCNPGFTLQGSEISKCQSNGQWSHAVPKCNRISCGYPGQIADGAVTGTNYKFGDKIQYSCTTGFTLIGSSERECLADGTWSCDTPRCTSSVSLIPRCPTLYQIQHGSLTFSNDNYYESIGEYSCHEGYYLKGNPRRACLVNQQWSGSEPTCEGVTCPRLTAPLNGQVTQPDGSPQYGSQATFSCNSGYRLDGDWNTICRGTEAVGAWSAAVPVCKAVNCLAPDRPKNGKIVGSDYTFQHKVEIRCGPGFFLQGPVELTCNENGAWIGGSVKPECVKCPLDHYKDVENSAVSCTRCPDRSHTVSTGSNNLLQCSCDTGYEGPAGGPCSIVTCPAISAPRNGSISPCGNEFQSVCELSCNPGHIISAGDISRQCLSSGFWDGEALKCKACPKNTYQNTTQSCARCPDNSVTSEEAGIKTDCFCVDGFESEVPGMECSNIDECAVDNPCQQTCTDTVGSFRCGCTSGYSLKGRPDENPTECVKKTGTCPDEDLIPPLNGGLTCGIVNIYEEYCSSYCNPGYEILDRTDEYITCSVATSWKWSHAIAGLPLPICTAILFSTPMFTGSISYFGAECGGMTNQEKQFAEDQFIKKLERHGVCSKSSGTCKVESADIFCGEVYGDREFEFDEKEGVISTNTLFINFNASITTGLTECTEIDCQHKFDNLVQVENERIRDELQAAIEPYPGQAGCPLCILDRSGNPLKMQMEGNMTFECPDGYQKKGYSCRECQPGTFHSNVTGYCELCPAGEYQPEARQSQCLSCPYLAILNKRGVTKCPVPPAQTFDCQTKNPCLAWTDPDYQKYYSHTNAGKYIQCSGRNGLCYVMPCPTGLIWSPKSDLCIAAEQIAMSDIY